MSVTSTGVVILSTCTSIDLLSCYAVGVGHIQAVKLIVSLLALLRQQVHGSAFSSVRREAASEFRHVVAAFLGIERGRNA